MSSLRLDRRQRTEVRALNFAPGVVPHTGSSAAVSIGSTKIVASLRGPFQLTNELRPAKGKIVCLVSCAPVSLDGFSTEQHRFSFSPLELQQTLESIIEQAVDLSTFPQVHIEVCLLVISSDGSELGACLAAVCGCLSLAGIPMHGLVAVCTSVLMPSGEIYLDPTFAELQCAHATCCVATLNAKVSPSICFLSHDIRNAASELAGSDSDVFRTLLQTATLGCEVLEGALRSSLLRSLEE